MLGWKNNAGSFWTMVAKLHLLIRTGRYTEDIMQISAADKVILEEIGYGNINAIEQQTSLSKEGYWEAITSLDGYCQIREAGRPFEKLKSVIEAYHPDFIFIFNWEERDDVFEGMDFEWQKVYYKDKLQAVYTLPGYSTKVIWTSHPRRYSYLGTNIEEMAGAWLIHLPPFADQDSVDGIKIFFRHCRNSFSNSMFLQLVLLMSEKDDADKGFGRYSLVWEAKC